MTITNTHLMPLVITDDETLLDLIAAATVGNLHRSLDPNRADTWDTAPLVLVGIDAAPGITPAFARRPGVIVVAADTDDNRDSRNVWEHAVAIGAEHVVFLPEGADWLRERTARLRDAPATAPLTPAPQATVTLTRGELLDLLTTAACIGRPDHGGTRGDVTARLLTYPAMRRVLPADRTTEGQ